MVFLDKKDFVPGGNKRFILNKMLLWYSKGGFSWNFVKYLTFSFLDKKQLKKSVYDAVVALVQGGGVS